MTEKTKSFRRMSKGELLDYCRRLGNGYSPHTLAKSHPGLSKEILRRELTDELVNRGIIKRKRKRKGEYSNKSDSFITILVKKNFSGKSPKELRRENNLLYTELNNRGLIQKLAEQGILRLDYRKDYFLNFSDEELKDFIRANYSGKNLNFFANSKDKRAYYVAHARGLIGELVQEGTLTRLQRKGVHCSKMSDEDIVAYVSERYSGTIITSFKRVEQLLYKEAVSRGLIGRLEKDAGLIRKRARANEEEIYSETMGWSLLELYVGGNGNEN